MVISAVFISAEFRWDSGGNWTPNMEARVKGELVAEHEALHLGVPWICCVLFFSLCPFFQNLFKLCLN